MIDSKIVELKGTGGKCVVEVDKSLVHLLAYVKDVPSYEMFELPDRFMAGVCEHGRKFQQKLPDGAFLFWSIQWTSDSHVHYATELGFPNGVFGGYIVAKLEFVSMAQHSFYGACACDSIVEVAAHEFYGCGCDYYAGISDTATADEILERALLAQLVETIEELG